MRIRTVLCPVDFTPLSEKDLSLAVAISRRFGAKLVVEHNAGGGPPGFMSVEWMWLEGHEGPDAEAMEKAAERLQAIISSLPADVSPVGKLSRGPVDAALLFAAADSQADLIVMGSHGWGGVDHHSVTETLISRAACPVLTVTDRSVETSLFGPRDVDPSAARMESRAAPETSGRDRRSEATTTVGSRPSHGSEHAHDSQPARRAAREAPFGSQAVVMSGATDRAADKGRRLRALVPVGLTRWSLKSVEMAVALGRDLGLDLTLLHVPTPARYERPAEAARGWEARRREALEDRIRAMLPTPPPEVSFISAEVRPKEAIVRVAEEGEYDLIVMGCHSGGGLRQLFTHTTSCEVLHGAPCPVWFVPRALKLARVEELASA